MCIKHFHEQVQHMLHEIEEFGHKQTHCADTHEPLNGQKVICYHCGKAFCKEVTNYQARMDEYGCVTHTHTHTHTHKHTHMSAM